MGIGIDAGMAGGAAAAILTIVFNFLRPLINPRSNGYLTEVKAREILVDVIDRRLQLMSEGRDTIRRELEENRKEVTRVREVLERIERLQREQGQMRQNWEDEQDRKGVR